MTPVRKFGTELDPDCFRPSWILPFLTQNRQAVCIYTTGKILLSYSLHRWVFLMILIIVIMVWDQLLLDPSYSFRLIPSHSLTFLYLRGILQISHRKPPKTWTRFNIEARIKDRNVRQLVTILLYCSSVKLIL